jgi:predicted O-methyltransferase YrrM
LPIAGMITVGTIIEKSIVSIEVKPNNIEEAKNNLKYSGLTCILIKFKSLPCHQ